MHTASDQKLEPGKAWERGYKNIPRQIVPKCMCGRKRKLVGTSSKLGNNKVYELTWPHGNVLVEILQQQFLSVWIVAVVCVSTVEELHISHYKFTRTAPTTRCGIQLVPNRNLINTLILFCSITVLGRLLSTGGKHEQSITLASAGKAAYNCTYIQDYLQLSL